MSIEGLESTTGDDKIGGDASANVLRGLQGNDSLYGGAGDDVYEFDLNHGQDVIIDAPYVSEDIIDASGAFNSTLFTATWTDLGFGPTAEGNRYRYRLVITRNGTGEEVYRSQDAVDFIYPSAQGAAPSPSAWPSDNSQWLNGASPTGDGDQITREVLQAGNGGNDTIALGAGISLTELTFTRLNGGADLQITYQAGNSVTISGQNNANRAIETLRLADGLTADLTRLRLIGEAATADGDFMVGTTGTVNDTLEGLAGNDVLSGLAGNDTLRGGDGDDSIEGGAGNDSIDGGNDSGFGDTARYVRSNQAVTINLETGSMSGGHALGDSIVRVGGVATIENLVGSEQFNDKLTGDSRINRLYGLGGNDTLEGRGGDDVLVGGDGGDTLRGGDGADVLTGDAGNDTLWGDNGDDQLTGGAGVDDMIGGSGNDTLDGGEDDDVLSGDAGNDTLNGGAGLDQLSGGDDDDVLAGGEGDDTLYGGEGNDELTGGTGDEWLDGEGGDDTFVFDANSGSDYVFDASGENRIVIHGATTNQIWITRSGDDLRIGVIGGTTTVTVVGYYFPDSSLLNEIALDTHSLFLASAEPLIEAMTLESPDSTPGSIPGPIAALLGNHWFFGNSSAPIVANQSLATNEDTPLTGAVGAIDPDANIVSYDVQTGPTFGNVLLDAETGAWTYTPNANAYGTDSFQILVTDADNQTALQTVTVQVANTNDAPTNISLTGAPAGIAERDHPVTGTLLNAIVLGTLSASDGDVGDTHVFSVTDARFEIVNGTTLQLKAGVALDFEATPTVSVDVTVQDLGGGAGSLSYTKTFVFNVNNSDDYFYGTAGDDTLTGQAGRNVMSGLGGNDTLTGGNANDSLDGGDGADTLVGQDGLDLLLGGAGTDLLQGGADGDILMGGGDDDRLEGGAGADALIGDAGNDVMIGGTGGDRFMGGDGIDTVSYETSTTGVAVNLATATGSAGDATGDEFTDTPEVLIGSTFGDTLIGSNAAETIEGRTGDDTIEGGGGADILRGGEGADTISAISGNDTIDGGTGNDTLIGGTGTDTYEIGMTSAEDEVRNFVQSGPQVDVLEYQNITRNQLWFQQAGNDLVVSVIGTTTRTTLHNWFLDTTLTQRANFTIAFDGTSGYSTDEINVTSLLALMAGYPKPVDQPAFDLLHGNPAFEEVWRTAWDKNVAPVIASIASQIINEDGTLTLVIRVTDEYTPNANVTVTAQAVNPNNHAVEDLSLVYAPTVGSSNAFGDRTITVTTKPNASGRVDIRVLATDGGGVPSEQFFILNIAAVPDVPGVTQATVSAPPAPATRPTFALGSLALNIQAALADTDGSESLAVRISGVPAQLSFNAGSNLGGGVWSFTAAELSGLRIQGPASFSQNIQLSVTAVSTESSNSQSSSPSAAVALNIDFNAAPSDIVPGNLSVSENVGAGTVVGTFTRVDPDSGEVGGDAPSFSLVNSAGGLFSINSSGTLTTNAVFNSEATGSYGVTVRVTDSGGLTYDEAFTIAVGDVNEAPFFSGSFTKSILEFSAVGTSVLTVAASDPDTNPAYRDLRYEIVGSPGPLQINAGNGAITVASVPNIPGNTTYNFNVRAWDGGAIGAGNSAITPVSVTVLDVDRAPTVTPAAIYVPENLGANAVVGTLSGSDPDGTLAYQLLAGQGLFNVNSAGQVIALQNFNYETTPWPKSYYISVRTWDGGAVGAGHAYDASVVMWITDQPETPSLSFTPRTDGVMGALVGTANIADDDSGNTFSYEIIQATQHVAEVWYQAGTPMGLYEYEGGPIGAVYFDNFARLYCTPTTAVYDQTGGSGWGPVVYYMQSWKIDIRVTDNTNRSSNVVHINYWGTSGQVAPIGFDLDGDGLELLSVDESTVAYSMSDTKMTVRTGWVGKDDALLALDRNGDGTIAGRTEISFIDDVAGATSDLEGLRAFDTNGDGALNAGDARFGEFLVWQDANQDGVSQVDELRSLADRGIESISLTRNLTGDTAQSEYDNVITATADVRHTDGTVSTVGDVMLAYMEANIEVEDRGPAKSDTPANAPASGNGTVPQLAPLDIKFDTGASDSTPRLAEVREPAPETLQPTTARDEAGASDLSTDRARDAATTDGWQYAGTPAQSALHAGLDLVARRRLQMIDAMASFSSEGAASLDLRPQRHVDGRTLELLTAVGGVRSAA